MNTSPITTTQRAILLLLARGYLLRHNRQVDTWRDSFLSERHSAANCQWLADQGFITLKQSVRTDKLTRVDIFAINDNGRRIAVE